MRITLINTAQNLTYSALYLPYGFLCLAQQFIDIFGLWNNDKFDIDYIVIGESEGIIVKLIENIKKKYIS